MHVSLDDLNEIADYFQGFNRPHRSHLVDRVDGAKSANLDDIISNSIDIPDDQLI